MKNFKKSLCAVFAIVFLMACFPVQSLAAVIGDKQITSQGAIVIDFETGVELYAHNADALRIPASTTKLLAAYVVFDAIKAGEISFDTVATISKKVSSLSYDREFSNVPLPVGSKISVSLLLEFVLVCSGCAATDALAEALCGDVDTFVARMNAKAASLGIEAKFHDTFGGSDDNRISARGLAVLTKNLISDHPDIFRFTTLPYTSYRGVSYNNTSGLLSSYPGADGMKTGFTTLAGYCFVGTAARDGRRIISVTLGSTKASRFPDSTKLLDYGFQVAENVIEEYMIEYMKDKIYPASSTISVNGTPVTLTTYNIGDYHYFKLRDIAALLNETEKSFEAQYDDDTKAVLLTSNMPYTPLGDELSVVPADIYSAYKLTASQIFLDDTEYALEVYNIDDYNYFKLRDLAALIDFGVSWDGETLTVHIDTSTGYVEDGETAPEDGETTPEDGETAPENGEPTPEDGETEPEDGETEPEDGETEPEDSEIEPEDSETTPEDGETAPEDGETAPEDGEIAA